MESSGIFRYSTARSCKPDEPNLLSMIDKRLQPSVSSKWSILSNAIVVDTQCRLRKVDVAAIKLNVIKQHFISVVIQELSRIVFF